MRWILVALLTLVACSGTDRDIGDDGGSGVVPVCDACDDTFFAEWDGCIATETATLALAVCIRGAQYGHADCLGYCYDATAGRTVTSTTFRAKRRCEADREFYLATGMGEDCDPDD